MDMEFPRRRILGVFAKRVRLLLYLSQTGQRFRGPSGEVPRAEVPPLRPGEPPPPPGSQSPYSTFTIPFSYPSPPSPPSPHHHRHCHPFCCLFVLPDLPKPRKSIPKLGQKSTRNPSRENIEIQTSKKLENHGQLYIGNMKIVGFP